MLKRRSAISLLASVCSATIGVAQQPDYIPSGPPESALLERWLDAHASGSCGIAPRAEILERAIPKESLPGPFVSKIETWVTRVLRPELKPNRTEDIVILGVPKLRWQRDFIVGHFPCESCDAPDKSRSVEFQASETYLHVTVHSARVKVGVGETLTPAQIMTVLSRFFAIPENKVPRFTVKRDCADVNDVRVCYGDVRCEYSQSDPENRKWWNYVVFWMADGTLFASMAMCDSEAGGTLRASREPIWPLRPLEKSGADFDPDVGKRPIFREKVALPGLGAGPEFRLDPRDFRILAREKISQEAVELMKARYESVLASGVLPVSAKDDVEWECFDVYGEYAPLQNPMTGKWVRDGVGVTVFGAPASETLEVTLKFTGDQRIAMRVPTKEERKAASGGGPSPPDAIDKGVTRRILTDYFRFPFANLDDFQLFGGGGVLEDVPVFMGSLKSRYAATEFVAKEQAEYAKLKWYDGAQLFITDSDPQYFCITIGRLGTPESTSPNVAPQ